YPRRTWRGLGVIQSHAHWRGAWIVTPTSPRTVSRDSAGGGRPAPTLAWRRRLRQAGCASGFAGRGSTRSRSLDRGPSGRPWQRAWPIGYSGRSSSRLTRSTDRYLVAYFPRTRWGGVPSSAQRLRSRADAGARLGRGDRKSTRLN